MAGIQRYHSPNGVSAQDRQVNNKPEDTGRNSINEVLNSNFNLELLELHALGMLPEKLQMLRFQAQEGIAKFSVELETTAATDVILRINREDLQLEFNPGILILLGNFLSRAKLESLGMRFGSSLPEVQVVDSNGLLDYHQEIIEKLRNELTNQLVKLPFKEPQYDWRTDRNLMLHLGGLVTLAQAGDNGASNNPVVAKFMIKKLEAYVRHSKEFNYFEDGTGVRIDEDTHFLIRLNLSTSLANIIRGIQDILDADSDDIPMKDAANYSSLEIHGRITVFDGGELIGAIKSLLIRRDAKVIVTDFEILKPELKSIEQKINTVPVLLSSLLHLLIVADASRQNRGALSKSALPALMEKSQKAHGGSPRNVDFIKAVIVQKLERKLKETIQGMIKDVSRKYPGLKISDFIDVKQIK